MKTVYRKDGWTSRLERTSRSEAWIVLSESGIAEMDGDSFTSSCTGQAPLPRPQGSRVRFLARRISNDVPADTRISRLTITEGRADHQMEGIEGKKEWSEAFGRIHLAVAAGKHSVTIDRGGSSLSSVDPAEIRYLTGALAGAGPLPAARICNLRLASAVTARILRELVDAHLLEGLPTRLQVIQMEHEDYPYDALGNRIAQIALSGESAETSHRVPGGLYRPTYRLPPIAIPLHIRLVGPNDPLSDPLDADMRAIEILQPFQVRTDSITAGFLCLDSENRAFSCGVSIDPRDLLASIRSIGREYRWFPYSAGAYGSEIDLEGVALRPLDALR